MRRSSGARSAVRARTALVVEDDQTIARALAGLLEDDGFEVITAATLERADYVVFRSQHPVGVVVLDLNMPDGSGEELLRTVCARSDRALPVVLLSSSSERVAQLAAEYGLPFLLKPFDVSVAAATVAVAFENDVRPHLRERRG